MRVLTVVGARPQFIKAAPFSRALRQKHDEVLIHTGQHYDDNMSTVFFDELGIPKPDKNLGIGGGNHGAQTGAMLAAIEQAIVDMKPAMVVVYGDTNSTLAGALAAAKLHVPVAHIEAGLRSFNRAMPEEVNRVLVDHIATLLFAPTDVAKVHLAKEGVTKGVHVVGDIMIDAIEHFRPRAIARDIVAFGVKAKGYVLATVHRAENTDDDARLNAIFAGLASSSLPVLLPLHPRTRKRIADHAITVPKNVSTIEPVGYLDMLALQAQAACIATDSGGVQKEAYALGVRCVTLRDETEWTETVDAGANTLTGAATDKITTALRSALSALSSSSSTSSKWPAVYGDGHAADRIVAVIDGA